ncbi:MAG: glycosyltransferase [Balneolaceae bacterium]|nr:glycosyltransferase [Balneolaceae bacterium]
MREYPEVTVIIPVYNMASTLSVALESLFSLENLPVEIVVVNDGSRDDTQNVIDRFEKKAVNLKWVSFKSITISNSGRAEALNEGVKLSRGEYLSFLDADDSIDSVNFKKNLECARNADSEMAIGQFKIVGEGGNISIVRKLNKGMTPEQIIRKIAYSPISPVHLNAILIKKSLFLHTGGFDVSNKKAEDKDLLIRLLRHSSSITICDSIHYIYLKHNLSKKDKIKKRFEWMVFRQQMIRKNYSGLSRITSLSLQTLFDVTKLLLEITFTYDAMIAIKRYFRQ